VSRASKSARGGAGGAQKDSSARGYRGEPKAEGGGIGRGRGITTLTVRGGSPGGREGRRRPARSTRGVLSDHRRQWPHARLGRLVAAGGARRAGRCQERGRMRHSGSGRHASLRSVARGRDPAACDRFERAITSRRAVPPGSAKAGPGAQPRDDRMRRCATSVGNGGGRQRAHGLLRGCGDEGDGGGPREAPERPTRLSDNLQSPNVD